MKFRIHQILKEYLVFETLSIHKHNLDSMYNELGYKYNDSLINNKICIKILIRCDNTNYLITNQ